MMVAPIIGPTIGGWITDNWSWRWNFYINVPIGIIAIIMVSTFLHDPPYLRKARRGGPASGLRRHLPNRLDVGTVANGARSRPTRRLVRLALGDLRHRRVGHLAGPVGAPGVDLPRADPRSEHPLQTDFHPGAAWSMVPLTFMLFSVNLLNPIFLQEFMGYSACRPAWCWRPRAVGAMAAMLLVGQIERYRFDASHPVWIMALLLPGPFAVQDGELEPANWLLGQYWCRP